MISPEIMLLLSGTIGQKDPMCPDTQEGQLNCLSLRRTSLGPSLKVQHPWKPVSPGQTGTIGPPTPRKYPEKSLYVDILDFKTHSLR